MGKTLINEVKEKIETNGLAVMTFLQFEKFCFLAGVVDRRIVDRYLEIMLRTDYIRYLKGEAGNRTYEVQPNLKYWRIIDDSNGRHYMEVEE